MGGQETEFAVEQNGPIQNLMGLAPGKWLESEVDRIVALSNYIWLPFVLVPCFILILFVNRL